MKNPAVDAYIAKSADFARPILRHVRKLMHQGDRRITETIKWGVPAFEHAGIVAMMAAFKRHVAFGFWSEKLIREKLGRDADRVFPKGVALGMGGRRYLAREELPPDAAILRAAHDGTAARVRRLAGGRQARGNARAAPGAGAGAARRGQVALLEVPGLLSA